MIVYTAKFGLIRKRITINWTLSEIKYQNTFSSSLKSMTNIEKKCVEYISSEQVQHLGYEHLSSRINVVPQTNPQLITRIIFSNESQFIRDELNNILDHHCWSDENRHTKK